MVLPVLTPLTYIAAFILVLVASFTVLSKTEILGENRVVLATLSIIITLLFISVKNSFKYIHTIIPWFAVLIVALVFILIIAKFSDSVPEEMYRFLGIAFTIILALILIISALNLFSGTFVGYFPGPTFGTNLEPSTVTFLNWLYTAKIGGSVIFIGIASLMFWLFIKK